MVTVAILHGEIVLQTQKEVQKFGELFLISIEPVMASNRTCA
jgi:hypothetical protein